MFLLFLKFAWELKAKQKFTFQYVSIISVRRFNDKSVWCGFTFQYVSIISFIRRHRCSTFKLIYIPICFYYFELMELIIRSQMLFTFQYVSIISLCPYLPMRCIRPFTFQYVSIISDQFSEYRKDKFAFTFQYVSIISHPARLLAKGKFTIYIPICFYYFELVRKPAVRDGRFTFQYVSIISFSTGSRCNCHY